MSERFDWFKVLLKYKDAIENLDYFQSLSDRKGKGYHMAVQSYYQRYSCRAGYGDNISRRERNSSLSPKSSWDPKVALPNKFLNNGKTR